MSLHDLFVDLFIDKLHELAGLEKLLVAGLPPDSATEDYAWRLWHWEWTPASIGNHTLMSRVMDNGGKTQPSQHNEDYESYIIDYTVSIPVEVI